MTKIDNTTDPRLPLRSRIRHIDGQIAELDARRAKLLKLRNTYEMILSQEDSLNDDVLTDLGADGVDETAVPAFHPTSRGSLADYIIKVLSTGPKSLEELKFVAAQSQWPWEPLKESRFPGRSLNFALVGLQKGGHVERQENGKWKLVSAKVESEAETPR
jgi:hypothetical protein